MRSGSLPCLILAISLLMVTSHARVTIFQHRWCGGDARQNVAMALNLARYGTISDRAPDRRGVVYPTAYREPGYPFVLALGALVGYRRLPELPAAGNYDFPSLRWVNVAIFLLLLLVSAYTVYELTGNLWLASLTVLIIGQSDQLIASLATFAPEPLEGLYFLLLGLVLQKAPQSRNPIRQGLFAGVTLLALTLTRAIFIYFAPFALFSIWCRKLSPSWFRKFTAAFLTPFVAGVFLWEARNYHNTGRFYFTERGGFVLTERMNYLEINMRRWPELFLAWTPTALTHDLLQRHYGIFPHSRQGQIYDQTNIERNRLQKSMLPVDADRQMTIYALRNIFRRIFRHLLISILFCYRGIFVASAGLSLFLFWGTFQYLNTNRNELLRFLPGLFSFFFCSFLSTNIPRYHIALIPTLWIATNAVVFAILREKLSAIAGTAITLPRPRGSLE